MIPGILSLPHESASGNRFPTPALLREYNADRTVCLNTLCYSTSFYCSNFYNRVPGSCQKQRKPATPGPNDHYNLHCTTASGEIKHGKKTSGKVLPSRSWKGFFLIRMRPKKYFWLCALWYWGPIWDSQKKGISGDCVNKCPVKPK